MAAAAWISVPALSDVAIGTALLLLQKTYNDGQYSHLSVKHLQNKMTSSKKPLYIWSYGSLETPNACAFFFWRVKHKKSDPQESAAFCMTIGARPKAEIGGMDQAEVIAAIADVCKKMRALCSLPPDKKLEVMHAQAGPNFRASSVDAAGAYSAMTTPSNPPNPIRFIPMPDIVVDDPWADVPTTMTRWNIKEQ